MKKNKCPLRVLLYAGQPIQYDEYAVLTEQQRNEVVLAEVNIVKRHVKAYLVDEDFITLVLTDTEILLCVNDSASLDWLADAVKGNDLQEQYLIMYALFLIAAFYFSAQFFSYIFGLLSH